MPPHRRSDIDTLRGLACLLLVSFHVVGVPEAGLRLPADHGLARVNEALALLRMPLFSAIAGYVYAMRPVAQAPGRFVRAKVRRLLLPLLTVGTVFAVVQHLTPGTHAQVQNWWLLHIVPVGHFWYLQALFLIFLATAALERGALLATPRRLGGVLAASVLAGLADVPPHLGASGAVYLLPFFLLGLACRRFDMGAPPQRALAGLGLVAGALWLAVLPPPTAGHLLAGVAVGMAAAFLLLTAGWRVRGLAWIGGQSFAIYLLHVFFTAASRMLLSALGVSELSLHLLAGTAAGVLGPLAVARALHRSAWLELLFLGQGLARTPADRTRQRPGLTATTRGTGPS